MNQLQQIFNYQGQQLRIVIKNNEPWFAANDVCELLDIRNSRDALNRLDEDEKAAVGLTDAIGREQNTNIISESGLYALVLSSRKPEAKDFQRWIRKDVIPSIRKTGMYHLEIPKSQAELSLMIAQTLVEQEKRINHMESTMTTMQETFLQRDEDWRKNINHMFNTAAFRLGGNGNYQNLRNESYRILEERAHCNLNIRLNNLIERLQVSGATKTKINRTSKMDIIESDTRLKEIYTTIVKEFTIGSLTVSS